MASARGYAAEWSCPGDHILTPDDLDALLANWAAWCRERSSRGQCASIEHLWRSPQEWYTPGAPAMARVPVDSLAALEVNKAWRVLPQPWKQILADWYCLRRDPRRTCARCHIAFRDHEEYMDRARTMLVVQLTKADKKRTSVARSLSSDLSDRAPIAHCEG